MKNLLVLATLVFAHSAFSQSTTPIQAGDRNITKARATLVSVKEICPANPGGISCMAIGSQVKIEVHLGGCADKLGGYFYKFEKRAGKPVLAFGALRVATKASMSMRCIKEPSTIVTVYVEENIKSVKLEDLNFMGTAF